MCGIFGFITLPDSGFDRQHIAPLLAQLLIHSESRGKDACGVALVDDTGINVFKRPVRARKAIRSQAYRQLVADYTQATKLPLAMMGHARMVTNGDSSCHENNQPVIVNDMVCLHNGIIVNDAALWQEMPNRQRQFEVDTEVFLNLIEHYLAQGEDLPGAFHRAFFKLEGANTVALLHAGLNAIFLATSNGSLYITQAKDGRSVLFGSEAFIVRQVQRHNAVAHLFADSQIRQIEPNQSCVIHFDDLAMQPLSPNQPASTILLTPRQEIRRIQDDTNYAAPAAVPKVAHGFSNVYGENDAFIQRVHDSIAGLKRCTHCLLPETFPYIEFDEHGECNYCRAYQPYPFQGHDALEQLVSPIRREKRHTGLSRAGQRRAGQLLRAALRQECTGAESRRIHL
jgi:glucosamine--fructose-6-phosphate aminotransferase (isomerizing)